MESKLKVSTGIARFPKRHLAPAITLALALLVASSGFWGASVTSAASNATTQPGAGQQSNTQSPDSPQHYQDVPPSSPFYDFVQNIADAGIVAGYACGTPPAGVCVPPAICLTTSQAIM
jgi:S-layer homology domain